MPLDKLEVHEQEDRHGDLIWSVQFQTYDRATLNRLATLFDLPLRIVVDEAQNVAQASDISDSLTDALFAIAHAGIGWH